MAFQITLTTMIVFFVVLTLGFFAAKFGIISKDFNTQLAQLITKIFLPVLIFYSTTTSVTLDLMKENLILFPLSIAIYVALAVSSFLIAKIMRIEHDKDRIFQFTFIFGNTGFVGFPLLSAVFPGTGILFMCMFTVVDQIVFWTYGVWLSTARGGKAKSFKIKSLLSPNIIAIVVAILYVCVELPLPGILENILGTVSKATTPMCMMFLGATIFFNNVAPVLKRADAYVEIVIKMLILPICAGLLCKAAGMSFELAGCVALYVALPVMTVVPMISAQNGNEGAYATGIAVMTFVACVITIPVVAYAIL